MANIPSFVVVHCSDSPDFSTTDQAFDSIGREQIDQWHRARGFKQIGYHFVIRQTGVLEIGRLESEIGAHCKGHNTNSLGICLVGRGKFSDDQKKALFSLFVDLYDRWRIPIAQWYCHNQFNQFKTCPNTTIDEVKSWLLNPKS